MLCFIAEQSKHIRKFYGYLQIKVFFHHIVIIYSAAVLTAVNLTDELFKSQAAAEQLRGQIKGYLDEASKAQSEVSELKREVFRLQQRLDNRK